MEIFTNNAINVYLNSRNENSKHHFTRNVDKFVEFKQSETGAALFQDSDVYKYMNYLHEIGLKTSSLKVFLSQIKTFYELCFNNSMKSMEKVIYRNFKLWGKTVTTDKAKVIKLSNYSLSIC